MKFGLVGFLVAGVVSLTVVSTAESRRRARHHHCRNNCRRLGEIAGQEISANKLTKTGRLFWHQVRFRAYTAARQKIPAATVEEEEAKDCTQVPCRNPKHEHAWKSIWPDPFVCPVYGRTVSNREDPETIDYRGPRVLPVPVPERFLIGADRPGNHPDGSGFVLYSDRSIQEKFEVQPTESGTGLWKQAGSLLGD